MADKNSFILMTKYESIFADMSDRQAGVLIKAIFHYVATGETMDSLNDVEVKTAFKFVKLDLDYNNKKYIDQCQQNSLNGKKGGAPKGNSNAKKQPKQPTACFTTETSERLKNKPNDNDVDIDVDNDIDITTKTPLPPLGELTGKTLSKAFARWLDYRKQIKKPYKSKMSIAECYARLEKLSGGDLAIAEKIVSQSIAQGWQGLFELKDGGKENAGIDYNRNPDEDKYDGFGRKI